jgi:hypothetical protein
MSLLGPKADKMIEDTHQLAVAGLAEAKRHNAEVERLLSVIAECALRGAK